jgi:hypothetical protein
MGLLAVLNLPSPPAGSGKLGKSAAARPPADATKQPGGTKKVTPKAIDDLPKEVLSAAPPSAGDDTDDPSRAGGHAPTDASVFTSIEISPAHATIKYGGQLQFTAEGRYADGSSVCLASVSWSSEPSDAVSINGSGLASACAAGPFRPGEMPIKHAAIKATHSGKVAVTTLTVIADKVPATPAKPPPGPATPKEGPGGPYALTVNVTSSSSDEVNVDIARSKPAEPAVGLAARGRAGSPMLFQSMPAGTYYVAATQGKVSKNAQVTFPGALAEVHLDLTPPKVLRSITFSPANPKIPLDGEVQLTAIGTYDDGSSEDVTGSVEWNSEAPGIVAVDGSGLAISMVIPGPYPPGDQGTATITATDPKSSVSGSTTVTVTVERNLMSIRVNPVDPVLLGGGITLQFVARAEYSEGPRNVVTDSVAWSSSTSEVAEIDCSGLATSGRFGEATITATATDGSGVSGSTTLTVKARGDAGTLRFLTMGLWRSDLTPPIRIQGGQVMRFVLNNVNAKDVTVSIDSIAGKQTVNVPGSSSAEARFKCHGDEPMYWAFTPIFEETALSGGDVVAWKLYSTWIPGDPASR